MKLGELQLIVTEVLNSMFQCVIGLYGTLHRTLNQFSIPRGGTQLVNCWKTSHKKVFFLFILLCLSAKSEHLLSAFQSSILSCPWSTSRTNLIKSLRPEEWTEKRVLWATYLKAMLASPPCGVFFRGHVNHWHNVTNLQRRKNRRLIKDC